MERIKPETGRASGTLRKHKSITGEFPRRFMGFRNADPFTALRNDIERLVNLSDPGSESGERDGLERGWILHVGRVGKQGYDLAGAGCVEGYGLV